MIDYLQPVQMRWRLVSVIGCLLAFLVSVGMEGVVGMVFWQRASSMPVGSLLGLSLAATFIALLGCSLLFCARRILGGRRSDDGPTLLPVWFIRAFGLFMLIAHLITAWINGSFVLLVEGTVIFATMLFIGRRIERWKRAADAENAARTSTKA